jgi:hypothetical protein
MSNTSISGLPESLVGNSNQEFPINDGGVTRKIKLGTMIAAINSSNGVDGVATTTALPANTYNNGTSGVGATLTANANGVLVVDGVTITSGMSILVKNESTQANNGLYTVTLTGSSTSAYILTRSVLMNQSNQFSGAVVVIGQSGTVNANSFWVCAPYGSVVIGTTSISFVSNNPSLSGFLIQSSNPTLVAAGTNQATATALTTQFTVATTVASGTGVIVSTILNMKLVILNRGSNTLLIYPPVGAQFENYGVNSPVSLPVGGSVELLMVSSTLGYVC